MYIVIVGAGNVGYHLAKAVLSKGHEVLLIDRDAATLERIEDELGSIGLNGDGCEANVLEEAGTARADLFVAVTDQDADNLVACQIAKHRFKVPRTVARMSDLKNEPLFKKLGVDVTVSSTILILQYIETQTSKPRLLTRLAVLRGSEREMVDVRIPPTAAVVGKKIRDISLPQNSLIILLIRQDERIQLPTSTTTLEAGDRVVVVGDRSSEEGLHQALTGS
ncbi:MAG: TrkA family potassium uptake protein [Dehalococcoidia bacterium]|nr:TrkA family potassium uptake protein [Dehalococcoidia bacterium]